MNGGVSTARLATIVTGSAQPAARAPSGLGKCNAKKLAKLLRDDLAVAGFSIPHSLALELIAHQLNAKDWNVLAAAVGRPRRSASPEIRPGVPVLRVMSVEVALPFYVSRSQAVLHLSEQHGDGGPTLEVIDPYGNVLRFVQPSAAG